MMVELPQIRTRKITERVIDARMCLINKCPFLTSSTSAGVAQYGCGAGVFRAKLPAEQLHDLVSGNPSSVPGWQSDHNPFLLRLLMARECLRSECGVAELAYSQKVLEIDPDEVASELFS